MNPVKQIGRYSLPILNVQAIIKRPLLRLKKPFSRYAVILTNGHTLFFTEKERQQYARELEKHAEICKIWGMCKSLGLRA